MPGRLPVETILLVDDEVNILSSIKRLLRPEGYNVLTAKTGPAGLEMLAAHDIQVVVSDGLMADMRGTEFLGTVKAQYPACTRIMLTGRTDPESSSSAYEKCDLFALLFKPWDDAEVLKTVRAAFKYYEDSRLG